MPDTERQEMSLPEGPWKCFYCGEVCNTVEEAQHHFGLGTDDNWQAACVDPLRADERDMRAELVDTHKELNAEREENYMLRGKVEGLEYALHLLQQREPELMRRLKGATLSDALHNLDSLEGRALAAEAFVAEVRRRSAAIHQEIQDFICRPVEPAKA